METMTTDAGRPAAAPFMKARVLPRGGRARPAHRQKVWGGYAASVALFAVVFTFWQLEPVPWAAHCAGILLFALCLFPLALWRASGSNSLPMFELICLSYCLQFGLPLYLQPNEVVIRSRPVALPWEAVQSAMLLAVVGVASMIVGYYLLRALKLSRRVPRLDLPLAPYGQVTYLKFSLCVGLAVTVLRVMGYAPDNAGPLGALVRVLTNQINIALIVLACQVYSVERPKHVALISLYSLTTAVSLLGLSSGMLENALTPWAVVLIARWHVSRKVAWRLIIIGALAFAFFNPVKREYRNEVWFGDEAVGVVDSITIWFQLAGENIQGMIDGSKQGEESSAWMQETTSRLDLLHRFAYVGEMTPAVVPFYRGSTYSYIWTGWIPRFVWPDKPSASESNRQMDVDYVLLEDFQAADTGVSIGIGLLPESWANFGLAGVIAIMMLQGGLLAALNLMLNGPRSEGGAAIYLSLTVTFLNGIGTTFVLLFTSLLQNVIANALLLRPFAKSLTAPDKAPAGGRALPPGYVGDAKVETSL
jgi:hypothetical protein